MNYLSSDHVYNLGFLARFLQIVPNAPNTLSNRDNIEIVVIMLQIPKNRSNLTLTWLCQLTKTSFNVNYGVEDFVLLFMCPSS